MSNYMKRDPNKKKVKVGFNLDEDVNELLNEMAIELCTSRTGVIQKLVRDYKEIRKERGD